LCGAAAAFGAWRLGARFAERLGLFWLLRTYVFLYRWRLGRIPEVNRRVGEMAEQIYRSAVDDPVDEILVVGHSVGTVLAVSVMARVLEKMEAESRVALLSRVHVLTLGHCIPLVLFLPGSTGLREDLAVLAAGEGLRWTDVSAKADPLCFFNTDPVRVAGVEEAGVVWEVLDIVRISFYAVQAVAI
jgi:alpha-beta hydrolase superfamily lysophospholipase